MSKKSNEAEDVQNEDLKDVDELAKQFEINTSVFAGVKMLMGWKKGKQLTAKDFKEAVEKFNRKSC